MIIVSSISMPHLISQGVLDVNKSTYDTPIYNQSLVILSSGIVKNNKFEISIDDSKFEGFLPYANTKISKKQKYSSIAGKTIKPGIYCGICGNYKGNKAFYLFTDSLITSKNFFYDESSSIKLKPSLSELIDKGTSRVIPTEHFNPVRNGYWASGINIHNGPQMSGAEWNSSLGCITVEPKSFQIFLKYIKSNQMIVYIHHLDELANENKVDQNNFSIDIEKIRTLNNFVKSIINTMRQNND